MSVYDIGFQAVDDLWSDDLLTPPDAEPFEYAWARLCFYGGYRAGVHGLPGESLGEFLTGLQDGLRHWSAVRSKEEQ